MLKCLVLKVKDLYANDTDFSEVHLACDKTAFGKLFLSMMVICLKKVNCVCLIVQYESCW